MTYTQIWDHMKNQVSDQIVQRDEDGAFIPFDQDNTDYQDYLAWLDKGNQPTPYTPPATTEGESDGPTPEQGRHSARAASTTAPTQSTAHAGEHPRPAANPAHGPAAKEPGRTKR
jgi:hypothetical protein